MVLGSTSCPPGHEPWTVVLGNTSVLWWTRDPDSGTRKYFRVRWTLTPNGGHSVRWTQAPERGTHRISVRWTRAPGSVLKPAGHEIRTVEYQSGGHELQTGTSSAGHELRTVMLQSAGLATLSTDQWTSLSVSVLVGRSTGWTICRPFGHSLNRSFD